MSRRGVFLDLNGTLVEPLKQERLNEVTLISGVASALARFSVAGFVCPVVTVQSRIAKGLFTMTDFEAWFANFSAELKAQGALVVGPYVCPHRLAEPCPCKKPNVLLYNRAVNIMISLDMVFLKSSLAGVIAILLDVLVFAGYYATKGYLILRNLKATQNSGMGYVIGTDFNVWFLLVSSIAAFILAFSWRYRRGR